MATAITTETTTTLTTLANEINEHHRAAEAAIRSGLEHALEAGRLLTEAKAQCPHGTWGGWLEEHFDGSERTARAYMQVAEHWPEIEAKRQTSAVLNIDGALKMLAAPRSADKPPPEEGEFGKLLRKAAEAIGLPELSGDVALWGDGRNETGALDCVAVHPSRRSPGFYWVAVYLDFNFETARMEYIKRPVLQAAVGLVAQAILKGRHPNFDWTAVPADEADGTLADIDHAEGGPPIPNQGTTGRKRGGNVDSSAGVAAGVAERPSKPTQPKGKSE